MLDKVRHPIFGTVDVVHSGIKYQVLTVFVVPLPNDVFRQPNPPQNPPVCHRCVANARKTCGVLNHVRDVQKSQNKHHHNQKKYVLN